LTDCRTLIEGEVDLFVYRNLNAIAQFMNQTIEPSVKRLVFTLNILFCLAPNDSLGRNVARISKGRQGANFTFPLRIDHEPPNSNTLVSPTSSSQSTPQNP